MEDTQREALQHAIMVEETNLLNYMVITMFRSLALSQPNPGEFYHNFLRTWQADAAQRAQADLKNFKDNLPTGQFEKEYIDKLIADAADSANRASNSIFEKYKNLLLDGNNSTQ